MMPNSVKLFLACALFWALLAGGGVAVGVHLETERAAVLARGAQ